MSNVPFSKGDWQRKVAREAGLLLYNRYYEANPVLVTGEEEGASVLDRPKLRRYKTIGSGPGRAAYSQPGTFGEGLFVVSGDEWYLNHVDDTHTLLTAGIAGTGSPVMAGTGYIGEAAPIMWMADGVNLWAYTEDGYAMWDITTVDSDATFQAGGVYYQFTAGSVDAGTPAGTAGNPWLVAFAGNPYQNLADALDITAGAGSTYSTALLTQNPAVRSYGVTPTSLRVKAILQGTDGNAISIGGALGTTVTQTYTGGAPSVVKVPVPENDGIISVGYLSSFIIAVVAEGGTKNGRFYWIEPGEISIDPLNWATAEAAPDAATGVVIFNDLFWLPGITKTEVWYFTGDPAAPVLRQKGVGFERGAWAGTACQVKDSMFIVDSSGSVFQASGGMTRVSNPGIAERIRKAIKDAS